MLRTIYLTEKELENIYKIIVRRYNPDNENGCFDDINRDNLRILINEPKTKRAKSPLYPTIFNKAAMYLVRILDSKTSPFPDYRRQTGISAAHYFLEKNGVSVDQRAHVYQEIVEAIEKHKKNILEISAMIEENSRSL